MTIEQNEEVVLCGDFNENFADVDRTKNFLIRDFKMEMLSNKALPTTDAKTTIDAVFGHLKKKQSEVFVYESYFSFHKPIVLRMSNL